MPPIENRAAEHMVTAMKALFRDNSSRHVSRFPSGGVLFQTGEPSTWGNFAFDLDGEEWADAARRLESAGQPAMIVRPGPRDTWVEAALGQSGFAYEGPIPAMEVGLADLRVPDLPSGTTFERIARAGDGEGWARGFSDGFPVPLVTAREVSSVRVPISDAEDAPVQYFVVRSGAEVAGVSCLVLADGLAGIYCVATLPAYRKRGIGAVFTARPLAAARELGYETGVLQASPEGYPVYLRLGFVDAGEVQLYVMDPDASATL